MPSTIFKLIHTLDFDEWPFIRLIRLILNSTKKSNFSYSSQITHIIYNCLSECPYSVTFPISSCNICFSGTHNSCLGSWHSSLHPHTNWTMYESPGLKNLSWCCCSVLLVIILFDFRVSLTMLSEHEVRLAVKYTMERNTFCSKLFSKYFWIFQKKIEVLLLKWLGGEKSRFKTKTKQAIKYLGLALSKEWYKVSEAF
jgi:hypothetical protein